MGKEGHLVTMSAGNYGRFVPFCFSSCHHLFRSYAEAARSLGLTATVLLPTTAPASRETLLKQVSDGFARKNYIQEAETIYGMELILFLEPKTSIKSIFRIAIVKERNAFMRF